MSDINETIMRLQHENDMLKNRCYAQTMGHLCKYCPFTCINRTKEFRGKEKKK